MSDWIVTLNDAGESWLGWLIERSLVSGIALAIVLAVLGCLWLAGRQPWSAHLPSRLLLIPLLLLIVPLERALPIPGALPALPLHAAPPASTASPAAETARRAEAPPPNHRAFADASDSSRAPASLQIDTPQFAWPTLGLLAWSWQRHRGAVRMLHRHSRAANAGLQCRFLRLTAEAGIDRAVDLRLVDDLASPLAGGVLRPTIYVPADLEATMTRSQLQFALRHELEHVRRRDVVTGYAIAALRLAFWFHPGVWLAAKLHARFCEYACDEAALARSDAARTTIADSLFTLVERACGPTPPALAHALSQRTFMKTRLLRILDSRQAPRTRMSGSAAALLVVATLGTMAAARPQAPGAGDRPVVVRAGGQQAHDPVAVALTEGAVWLLKNQQPDGSWVIGPDPRGHNQRDHNSTCVTAMAVLALLPGLRDEQLKIAQAVQRAGSFLEQSQREDGRFGPDEPMTMMYAHAWTLRALCALQQEWPEDLRRDRIEHGVKYAIKAQNPYMGWRYGPRDGDNDSKITGMMLLALYAARDLGIEIHDSVFTHGKQLLSQLTNKANGRVGFVRQGGQMSRFTSKKADFPGNLSEEPTALTVLVRSAAGEPIDHELNRAAVELVTALPPEWNPTKGSIDLAYWQFGAEVMAKVDRPQAEDWRRALHRALIPSRITEGGAAHWPAIDAWSHEGMEAYSTAAAMMALRALR